MNLGFFTMPIHPPEKDWRLSLREDREAFLLADELGFIEGYVGEHITDRGYMGRPLQLPHPPIVVTAVAPFSKGVTEAAARGWDPISANFLMPVWVKSHWPRYVEGCERGGRVADPANWRVAKSVFVAKDASTAKAYATAPEGPYVYYYRSLFTKLKMSGRIELFKTRRDQPDHEVTLETICDKLIIYGT